MSEKRPEDDLPSEHVTLCCAIEAMLNGDDGEVMAVVFNQAQLRGKSALRPAVDPDEVRRIADRLQTGMWCAFGDDLTSPKAMAMRSGRRAFYAAKHT